MSAELTRLLLQAYPSPEFKGKAKDFIYLQANPESYSVNYSIEYSEPRGKGSSGFVKKWEKNPPRTVSFEFILDNTGVIPAYKQKRPTGKKETEIVEQENLTVNQQIEKFEKLVFKVDGKKHEPNYLMLVWGTFIFGCRLQSMSITYKLFASDGNPLRASINATFIEVNRETKQIFEDNFQSPDVTHALTVKGEESLPMMTEKVYGSNSHYIAVAQANKLIHFRNIKAGDTIVFPPIKDQYA